MTAELSDDELHALITLMSLKHAGPRRLRGLLAATSGAGVVDALLHGRRPPELDDPSLPPVAIPNRVWAGWFNEIGRKRDAVELDAHRRDGRHILHPGHEAWPFADDPDPPILVFAAGDLGLLSARPSVAIVGTRRCTSVGREVAHGLGRELGSANVTVVSGLALGVDAAAHRGALDGGGAAIGVVASGLDTVYPVSNRTLWEAIALHGLLISEVPLGHRPTKWRFPARNRLIAGLSDLVVVVESHAKGGALSTVEEATERGISVAVVPGSTRSPASDGTNALLVEGAPPVRGASDVLDMLGIAEPISMRPSLVATQLEMEMVTEPNGGAVEPAQVVLDAVAAGPVHLDRLIELLGSSPMDAAQTVERLAAVGLVEMRGHVVGAIVGRGESLP